VFCSTAVTGGRAVSFLGGVPMVKRGRRAHGDGGVTLRKDGRWQGTFYDAERKRRFVYGDTKQEALEKLRKAQRADEDGLLVDGSKVKLDAYLEQWLEEVKRPTLRISSYVKYKKLINSYIVPALGNIQLQKLKPQNVQSLYTKLAKRRLSTKTINSVHGLLHNAFDHAVRWKLVPTNIVDVVTPPSLVEREMQPLDLDQARSLLASACGHRLEMLLVLALTTGMRRGELLALRWSDIDFKTRVLMVNHTVDYIARYGYVETRPKTKKSLHKIVLPGFVVDRLKEHREQQLEHRAKVGDRWYGLNLVFCGLEGNYLNPRYLNKLFAKVLKEAGLPHMHFHDLRHSVVTLLLALGVDIRSIQDLVGHKDITTTLRVYGHMLPPMQQGIADKFDDLFGE
jgi:integrase